MSSTLRPLWRSRWRRRRRQRAVPGVHGTGGQATRQGPGALGDTAAVPLLVARPVAFFSHSAFVSLTVEAVCVLIYH